MGPKVRSILLGGWFVVMNAAHLWLSKPRFDSTIIGTDARLYVAAADTWLRGDDPWATSTRALGGTFHFTNPPLALQVFAPLTVLPREFAVWLWMAVSLIAAIYVLHRLRLPGWWLLFPPLTEALLAGNPHLVMLGLLVATGTVVKALSVAFKVYAVVPLIGERRLAALIAAIALVGVSMVSAPGAWGMYLREFGMISSRLEIESGGGFSVWALGSGAVVAVTVLAVMFLAVTDVRTGAWLAVPALWPGTQFFYSTMALPVAGPLLAAALAVPIRGWPAVVVTGCVLAQLITFGRGRSRFVSMNWRPGAAVSTESRSSGSSRQE